MDPRYTVSRYLDAKLAIIKQGYSGEIDVQEKVSLSQVSAADFLREAAWVILSSGMRETIVRRKFSQIEKAFFYWDHAAIAFNYDRCTANALVFFNHHGKISAIAELACQVNSFGFSTFREEISTNGLSFLENLPFIGPITSYHLGKNIGMDVVKPDRHLVRIADVLGFTCPHSLCSSISEIIGDKISVIDLVLWRFAVITRNYIDFFQNGVLPQYRNEKRQLALF